MAQPMMRGGFLRVAAIALVVYGILGLLTGAAILAVGYSTFEQVASLQRALESERLAIVRSIVTASVTLRDTASATIEFERSVDAARDAADRASTLANDSAGTFRELGSSARTVRVLGTQPLAGISPQFDRGADQLQLLAISLGSTRDALGLNKADVRRVGVDLLRLQSELDAVAAALGQPGIVGLGTQSMLPFQVAFYGMCVLVLLQSAFSLVAGLALIGVPRFPVARWRDRAFAHSASASRAPVQVSSKRGTRNTEH